MMNSANRPMLLAFLLAVLLATGCGEFEVRSLVLDLRVLAMQVDPPEVVFPFDPENLPDEPSDIEVQRVDICALVADPGDTRSLRFAMTACATTESRRCDDPLRPVAPVALGTVEDPETSDQPLEMCGVMLTDLSLFSVLEDSVNADSLSGFGGIEVMIDLSVFPEGSAESEAQFAAKRILFAPQIPADRVANSNPSLDELRVTREAGNDQAAELGRCGDVTPVEVSPGEEVEIEPIESEGSREDYVVPTFDGGSRRFTENHTYSYYSTSGEWDSEVTGGPKDLAGNDPPIETTWTAPDDSAEVGEGLDVRVWVVQRDERGGLSWYETCVRVVP